MEDKILDQKIEQHIAEDINWLASENNEVIKTAYESDIARGMLNNSHPILFFTVGWKQKNTSNFRKTGFIMKYKIYKMIKPEHLQKTVPDGYYMKQLDRVVWAI